MPKIKLSDIKIGKRIRVEQGDLDELAESIQLTGLICPITVRKAGQKYKLLAGYRRIMAHKILKLASINAIIVE